jgi:GNAT superfamily N-acetyltransferase
MKNQLRTFECVEPDADAYSDYSSRFGEYNKDASGWQVQTYSLILRGGARIIAGGRGHVYLGALEVRGLWVDDDLRGTGIGSDLLKGIEQEARARGATKAMLYTYSWQAEAFYRSHGYKEFSRFDFPEGHYRIDMQKSL